ncbi:hypothetical protein ACQPZZ_25515 [Microbispora sp. CA-135349]|uniref:hypothetical protein n=1 Tax=Microbispora sp. CA-135349 TaxID=3239953 RepID=UPI003D8C7222
MVAGSPLTVVPLPFGWLLAGRVAQGLGLTPGLPAGRSSAVDTPNAVLLCTGLPALLLAISQTSLWIPRPERAVALVAAAAVLLGAWARRERRAAAPLVDLALLRNPRWRGLTWSCCSAASACICCRPW